MTPKPPRRVFPEGQIFASESEVARAVNKTPLTIWRWRKRGIMPAAIHLNGSVNYYCSDIERMVADGTMPPEQEVELSAAQQWADVMAANALQTKAFITVDGEAILVGSERYEKVLETLTEWTEGIVEEKIARYKLDVVDDAEWNALISDKSVIADVLREQHERRLSGASTQALARTLYSKGPRLLDAIANDATQPARARIDALRELRMQSGFATAEDGELVGQKFTLTIIVGDTQMEVGGPVIDVTPGPHNLTPEINPGPIIDASGWESYDMLGAPPLGGEYPSNYLDEVTAGIEVCE